ncbi:hypothetical protein M3Y98_00534700 [Aphelenchoides besseyi]|nr:hypothetical protein M3Y98_00534700 [Aphelenchoides besseyi]
MSFHFLTRRLKTILIVIVVIVTSVIVIKESSLLSQYKYCWPKRKTIPFVHDIRDDEIVPPLRKFESRFRKAPGLKTQVCVIEKNMSTILTAIICYFFNPRRFRNANRNVNREVFSGRFCARKNEAYAFMARVPDGLNRTSEWLHLSVSREPVERFVSGFVDKCLIEKIYTKRRGTCNGCRDNVTCFLEREYDRMRRFAKGEQNERFYEELFRFMRLRNASESDVKFVEDQVKNGRTKHTTSDLYERVKLEKQVRSSNRIEVIRQRWIPPTAQHRQYYGGIPVPGRRVPTLRFFEFYIASCNPAQRKDISLAKLSGMLQDVDAEGIAEKVFRQLSFTVDDLEIERLMGKWFVVVDSPGLHSERCVTIQLQSKTKYTATFSTVQKSRNYENVQRVYTGHGEKIGNDPGNIFIHTGHPNDPCPYFPVKVGPIHESSGQFEYMVITQPMKHPTMVLARDAQKFEREYRKHVEEYLQRSDFINPLTALNHPLQFINRSTCENGHQLHYNLDEE